MKKPQSHTPTLEDIAQAVGVSKMTVSRVLRGTGRSSEETAKKVKAAAEKLGYRPNPMIQTLMAGVRKKRVEQNANIAWVVTYKVNETLPDSLQEIEAGSRKRAQEMGYEMSRYHLDASHTEPEVLSRILKSRGVRGAIICPIRNTNLQPSFPWDDFAMATIGRSLSRPTLHYTMSHHYHIIQKVLDEVIARGYRKIGLLIGSTEWETRADHATIMVFQHHCSQAGLDPRVAYQTCGTWNAQDYSAWYHAFQPDAIIGDYGHRYHTLIEAGLPMDQIGYATLSWKAEDLQCSGVKQPFNDLGASAVDLVVAQIHRNERGIPQAPKAILMEGEWVEGSTLGPKP
ncbi:MAG: hypothetical protein CML13_18760 [Puniceicoccaceae bacterium]|nr:hypothetical protein [Puniceicoccaceae bacterium]